MFLPPLAAKIVLTPLHFIAICSIYGILFITAFIRFILTKNKTKEDIVITLFMYILTVIACGGYYLLKHISSSQMYFFYCAIPAIVYLAIRELLQIFTHCKHKTVIASVVIILCALPVFKYQYSTAKQYDRTPRVPISQAYIDTYDWIKSNTPKDALLVTNRHNLPDGTERWFYDAAYCDRQFYLSGYDYGENASMGPAQIDPAKEINALFFNDYERKHTLSTNLGVDYMLIYKEENSIIPYEEGFKTVFETDSTCVVQVIY